MRRWVSYLLFGCVLLVLWSSLLEKQFGLLPEKPLKGDVQKAERPELSARSWYEGAFQDTFGTFLNDHLGGHAWLIRIRNQYYFSVFNEAKANAIVPAKNGVLLDQAYVDAFYGKDFAGETFLTSRLESWKRVQHGLDSVGVKAFLCFAPGKASYFEEAFTDQLRDTHEPTTNYRFIKNWGEANGLRMLDLKALFHSWQDTSRYPLFPKGGIHWSDYAVAHVCDTLRGYVHSLTERPLPEFWFDIELSDTARGGDNDIADGMNLIWTPKHERLAYPIRYFGQDSTIAPTHLLAISDSYYYGLVNSGFTDRVCSYGGFWYYFRQAEPASHFCSTKVEELDLLSELKKQDVVMLMMTEPQLARFGWGAPERLEKVLYPETVK